MIFVEFFVKNLYFIVIFWAFFCLDFILGFSNAWKRKCISSRKMKESIPKFIGYNSVIILCLLFDTLIYLGTGFELIDTISPLTKIFVVSISFNEFISCIENAHKLGIYIPKFLYKLVEVLKDTNEK